MGGLAGYPVTCHRRMMAAIQKELKINLDNSSVPCYQYGSLDAVYWIGETGG
jgi:hypothetical protein